MQKSIDREFQRLVMDLRQYESLRRIDIDAVEQVGRSLDWLKASQRPEGYWGEHCLLDTEMSLLALGLWDVELAWALPDGSVAGIGTAFAWLRRFQDDSAAWESNVWDTAAILQAAARFGYARDESMVSARLWLEGCDRDRWGIDRGVGVHYVAQALIAMVACGSPQGLIDDARSVLVTEAELVGVSELWTPYAKGQVLSALISAGANPASPIPTRLADDLFEYLLSAEVTIANWLHLCSAFRGLGLALGTSAMDDPQLQVAVQRLFSPNRVRSDGSWYRSVPMTAWALIALESVRTVRTFDTYSFPIFQSLERSRTALMQEAWRDRRRRYWTFGYGAAASALVGVAGFLIFSIQKASPSPWEDREILLVVLPAVLALIGFVATRAWRLVRARTDQPGGGSAEP